jgi:mRNA-degrading endonuclease RelE of RelBE toxin-antitoxin system
VIAMELELSPQFEKGMRRLDRKTRELVYAKLDLFLQDKGHPSLRYKPVQSLKHLRPPVKEISVTMRIRITLQEFEDYIYLRNIGGHDILP